MPGLFRVRFSASRQQLRDALVIEITLVDVNLDRGCAGWNVVASERRHRAIFRLRGLIFIDH